MAKEMTRICLRRSKADRIGHIPPSLSMYGMNNKQKRDCLAEFVNFWGCTTPRELYRFIIVYAIMLAAFIILLCLKLFPDPSFSRRPDWVLVLIPLAVLINTIACYPFFKLEDEGQKTGQTKRKSMGDKESCSTTCICMLVCRILPLLVLMLIGAGLCVLGSFFGNVFPYWHQRVFLGFMIDVICAVVALFIGIGFYWLSVCEGK
jgi:cobalamin synthase